MIQQRTLRDNLACERTIMANERTLLSYGRTALGLLGLAVIIFKFGDPFVGIPLGIIVLLGAGALFVLGMRNYQHVNSRINVEEKQDDETLAYVETE